MDHKEFIREFFSSINPIASKAGGTVFTKQSDRILSYLLLADVLSFSVVSRLGASLNITGDTLQQIIRTYPNISYIGKFRVSFESNMTLGIARRVLHRIATGLNARISIDAMAGRVIMDIGSAFKDQHENHNIPLTAISEVSYVELSGPTDPNESILRSLEVTSCDEFDDYNPRHPAARDMHNKTHTRDNSMFNSDIEACAAEALKMTMELPNFSNLSFLSSSSSPSSGAVPRGMAQPSLCHRDNDNFINQVKMTERSPGGGVNHHERSQRRSTGARSALLGPQSVASTSVGTATCL